MNITMSVDTGNGPHEVTTTMWVWTQWERKFKLKASDMAKSWGMEDLSFLAYCCEQQNGTPVPAVFDDYIKKIRTLELISTGEETPTQGAPTADS